MNLTARTSSIQNNCSFRSIAVFLQRRCNKKKGNVLHEQVPTVNVCKQKHFLGEQLKGIEQWQNVEQFQKL
jgi:hypothetical protein